MELFRLSFPAAGLVAVAAVAAGQDAAVAPSATELMDPVAVQVLGLRCKTPSDLVLPTAEGVPGDCSYNSTTIKAEYDPTFVYEIPVVFHVIQSTGGSGNVSNTQVMNQIDVLNEDFRALGGQQRSGLASTR